MWLLEVLFDFSFNVLNLLFALLNRNRCYNVADFKPASGETIEENKGHGKKKKKSNQNNNKKKTLLQSRSKNDICI